MDTIEDLQAQIRRNPGRPDLHNALGRLYQLQGRAPEAAKHFLTAARLFSSATSPLRNVNKALAILKKMVREYPDSHDSYCLLADIYNEMGSPEDAVEVYSTLSEIYRKDGKLLMAVSVLDKVINAYPENMGTWVRFAELNSEAGMPFHAAHAYVRAANIARHASQAPARVFELAFEALRRDPENEEAQRIAHTLASAPEASTLGLGPFLDFVEDLDRAGAHEQAMELATLLEKSPVAERALSLRTEIAARSGLGSQPAAQVPGPRKAEVKAGTKVLVVDDEREIRLLLEQILRGEGYTVLTARDGEEAYRIFLSERPPLVVTDAMLPKLHGFELCRRIKEDTDQRARVMILTAVYKKFKYKGKVQKEFSVDEYLDKPFQISEFLEAFNRLAERAEEGEVRIRADRIHGAQAPEAKAAPSVLACVGHDREMASRVESVTARLGCRLQLVSEARELFSALAKETPDVLLLTERIPGLDPSLAVWIAENLMDMRAVTKVLIARDSRLLDGTAGDFTHRVAFPLEAATLESVLRMRDEKEGRKVRDNRRLAPDEKRIEAVVRSKVERVLKGQNQLEEYYNRRIRELEAQLQEMRDRHGKF